MGNVSGARKTLQRKRYILKAFKLIRRRAATSAATTVLSSQIVQNRAENIADNMMGVNKMPPTLHRSLLAACPTWVTLNGAGKDAGQSAEVMTAHRALPEKYNNTLSLTVLRCCIQIFYLFPALRIMY